MGNHYTELLLTIGSEERVLSARADYRWHAALPARHENESGLALDPVESAYAEIGKVEAEIHNGRWVDITSFMSQAQFGALADEIAFDRNPESLL